MKYITPTLSLLIVLTIATFPGCLSPGTPTNLNSLPSLTSDGRNTFGCIVDGNPIFNKFEEDVKAYNSDDGIHFEAHTNDLNFITTLPVGKAVVVDSTTNTGYNLLDVNACTHQFGAAAKNSNIARFHFRRCDNSVIAGTFAISISDECDTLEIVEGRFDVSILPRIE